MSRVAGIAHVWPQLRQLIVSMLALLTTSVPRGVARVCWHLGHEAGTVLGIS